MKKNFQCIIWFAFAIIHNSRAQQPYAGSLPPNPTPKNITDAEYYFDNDPEYGSGYSLTISLPKDNSPFQRIVNPNSKDILKI